jgi:hypothetical protein
MRGVRIMINQYKNYDEKYFKDSSDRHKVMTQFYRMIQILDYSYSGNEDFSDLFAYNMEYKSLKSHINGLVDFEEFINGVKKDKQSFHIENVTINIDEFGKFIVFADILRQELNKNGACITNELNCRVMMLNKENALPVIEKIEIVSVQELPSTIYKKSYAYNRARSVAHYWIYILENLDQCISFYDEILAPKFKVNTKSGETITDIISYREWLRAGDARVSYTSHTYRMFEILYEDKDEIRFKFQFDWQGYSTNHKPMLAKSQHHWVILNNQGNRFAQIKEIDMNMIIPFTIIEE